MIWYNRWWYEGWEGGGGGGVDALLYCQENMHIFKLISPRRILFLKILLRCCFISCRLIDSVTRILRSDETQRSDGDVEDHVRINTTTFFNSPDTLLVSVDASLYCLCRNIAINVVVDPQVLSGS